MALGDRNIKEAINIWVCLWWRINFVNGRQICSWWGRLKTGSNKDQRWKNRMLFDQVDQYMDDHLLVQNRICSCPTMHVTVTGAPVWLTYTNPCDLLLNRKWLCNISRKQTQQVSHVSIRPAEAHGKGRGSSCKHCNLVRCSTETRFIRASELF